MSSITRIRNKNFDKWFTINLEIHDLPADALSPEGKAFHTYLASKPDGWVYNRDHAIKIIGTGYKLDKACAELKAIGLLAVTKIREGGRIIGYDWQIEQHMPDQSAPDSDNQDTDSAPYPDRPDLVTPDPVIQDTYKRYQREEKKTVLEKPTLGEREPKTLPLFPDESQQPQKPKRAPKTEPKIDPFMFAKFWEQYPRREDRAKAVKAWDAAKINDDTARAMLHDIAKSKAPGGRWDGLESKFIPLPTSYLNGKRWEDEWTPPKPGQPPPGPRGFAGRREDAKLRGEMYLNSVINGTEDEAYGF